MKKSKKPEINTEEIIQPKTYEELVNEWSTLIIKHFTKEVDFLYTYCEDLVEELSKEKEKGVLTSFRIPISTEKEIMLTQTKLLNSISKKLRVMYKGFYIFKGECYLSITEIVYPMGFDPSKLEIKE